MRQILAHVHECSGPIVSEIKFVFLKYFCTDCDREFKELTDLKVLINKKKNGSLKLKVV